MAVAAASLPPETVHWTATVNSLAGGHNRKAVLDITGVIEEGWHVYALKQLEGGPTPLLVNVEPNPAAALAGKVSGTAPQKIHDPRFDLDTQFYARRFTLHVPLELQPGISAAQQIPVSVRFQTCNDRECQPPRTIHLSASLAESGS